MNKSVTEILSRGGVGVLLTDTLYGVVGSALDKKAVRSIYKIKGRDENKPFIILISSIKDLELFNIAIDKKIEAQLKKFWPGPVSIILPCSHKKFEYLHRGTNTLAFRLPKKQTLIKILKITGPLVAPSANPQGAIPARSLKEAKGYFGDAVDFYAAEGKSKAKPSKIVRISSGKLEILRK